MLSKHFDAYFVLSHSI